MKKEYQWLLAFGVLLCLIGAAMVGFFSNGWGFAPMITGALLVSISAGSTFLW